MRKKGIGKRILSTVLALALTVSGVSTGQMTSFATPNINKTAKQINKIFLIIF